MKASLQALVLVASGVTAFPSYLSCDRPLVVGHVIMGKEAIEETASATAFEGKECGGTYTPGEELTLTVSGGGTYMLEVSGGTLSISGNKCNSRRYANLGSSTASYAMATSVDKSLVEAWIGRGTGPTLADMPVAIFSKCTLTAAPASSTPTPAPSPGTSPTPAPTTSPTESKGGGAPLIVLPSHSSSGLELFVSLTIEQYLLVLPDDLQQYTSGYNGGLTGPTIRVKPGSTLHVELKNQLRRKTNLHTHGLHVHGRQPGDDVFVGTEPGDSFDYTFEIPSDHMRGTFLYHPHYHGSTAIQAGGGAAGLIIVEDAPNQLPSEIATLPEILIVLSHLDMPHLKSMGIEEETQCVAQGFSQEECDEPSWSDGPISDWLVRCPVGTHEFKDQSSRRRLAPNQVPLITVMAIIKVTEGGFTPCDLPTFEVNRPCYLVDLRDSAPNATLDFKMGPTPYINGAKFDEAISIITTWEGALSASHIYRLEGRTKDEIARGWIGLADVVSATREEGMSTMVANVPFSDSCNLGELVICRNKPTIIIAARGYSDHLGVHPGQTRITIDTNHLHIQPRAVKWDLWLHVISMSLAWLFCAPLALFCARARHLNTFKPFLLRTRFKGGRQYWYLVHRNCLITAVTLTTFAGVLMVARTDIHFAVTHSYFGVVTMCLASVQMIDAWLRPKHGHKWRKFWERLHKTLGISVLILGIKAAVQEAARRIEELCLEDLTNGPKFIRLAFRDAGTYDAAHDLYGPRASMRFEPEASHPSNRGLNEVRKLLEPIKQAFPVLSYADLWQLAAVVSIEMMGGPRVPFRVGRIDASGPEECGPAGMLPGAHDTAEELRSAFNRMGFNDGELVALMGAHTVGICRVRNSGFRGPWDLTSLRFDNLYYREVLKSDRWLYDGSQLNAANGDGTMLLETDLHMSTDAAFATWTRLFADDELMWFEMFAGAFQKLGELGHASSSLASADYTLFSVHTGQLQAAVEQAAQLVQILVEKHRVGPAFVRLAWQDAGTYNATDGKYGPRASMRFEPEASHPSNRGLERIRSMLEPIKQAVPVLSYADLWQLAAVVSIEMLGGPRVPFKVGRIDASGPEECAPPGMLPDAHDTAEELRSAFNRMGFNDRERVALMGAHTLGRCQPQNSGFDGAWTSDPLAFDNQYFKQQFDQQWASTGEIYENGLQDGTVRLNADMHLSTEPQLIRWATAFAGDEALFFSSFASAFQKMSQLGHTSLRDATFSLSPISPAMTNAHGDSVCLNRERGSCIVLLSWTVHPEDDSATATVKVAHPVGWVALAVSKEGRMTYPEPSYAIIGSNIGIRKHILQAQDVTSLTRSAPLDSEQSVRDASFERSNGFATLRFRTNLTWFTRYADAGTGASFFMYAHGAPGDTSAALGYHGKANRGNRQVSAFGLRQDSASLLAQEQVQNATTMIAKLVATRHVGPALVRLAWQDAGTFDARQHKYGPRASMRFDPEASHPSNRGLNDVRALLEPIKQAASLLSYADLWQLAAVVSIEMMGGPRVPFRIGRIDASGPEECAPAGMLPGAHDSAEELRSAFNRMGFNDEELVALAGARTLGRCHFQNSGFDGSWTPDPLSFDNKFYTTILADNISHDGNKWISVHGIMLDADLAFKNDSKFRVYTDRFAGSEPTFFEAFAKAFSKLSELGWTGLAPVSYTIPTMPVAAVGVSDGVTTDIQLGDTSQQPLPPSPPFVQTKSFSPRPGVVLEWTRTGVAATRVSLRVELHVQWLAFAVSATGKMILPLPSRAVVGTMSQGVYQRTLVAKDMTAISSSAPIDSVQSLTNASLTQVDGATILAFTVDHSFLTQFTEGGSAVNFIFSHGEPDSPSSTFGYHGPRRGSMLIQDFETTSISAPSSPPPSPWLPLSTAPVEFTPQAGVSLVVALKEVSSVASIKLVLQRQVPWLSVAVSHSGWMTDPNSSKAVVGDLASSVFEYNLVSQNPSMPAKSVKKPIDNAGLIESSVSFADGLTVLQFDIPVGWLTTFARTGDVWLLWAHGSATLPSRFPSYHAGHRGAVLVSREDLLGEYLSPNLPPPGSNGGGDDASGSNPPPPPPQPPDASSCDCGDEVDWCGEMEAFKVAKCYVSDVSLTPTTFSTNHSVDYDHELLLSSEYRIKWKVHGAHPNGEISIFLEARTTGWLGFGLMGDPSADGNGMINSDIYIGAVVDGVADVLDTWSSTVAAPIQDKQFGHTNDIYDIGGFENAERGMTTIWFTRKLVTNDTWDYNFDPGVSIPIIFAYSRKNVDSFSHYHGPTRGFDQIVFIPLVPPHDFSNLAIAAGVAVAMVLFMLVVDYSKKRMQAAAVRAARLAVLTKQIDDSVEGAGKFMFGMVLLRASDFLKHGKFIPYETLRDANEVKLLDTIAAARKFAIDKSIIFFSHQWLGWDEPDPNRVHYACMKNAVERIIEESTTSLEQTWVWVDYSCMPQLNQTTLGLAVSDLSEVACLATFFVVVAPPTLHQDSGAKCDLISYQARGWCRLEQFSFVCTGKTGSMLVSTGGGEETFAPYISQPAEWKKQALWVLQGEYTCCSRSKNHTVGDMLCDKAKLKPALLRMYMKAICHLPPCPLREQLLERDFEILHADSFDDYIVTLARKKFAQVSTMATKIRRLSFTRDFHSTVSHPFHKHAAASETANDTFSDTSFNLMPFGHPSKDEDLRDVSILHGPSLVESKRRQVAESQLQVTTSSLQNSRPQPNCFSSDGTDALGKAGEGVPVDRTVITKMELTLEN
ncbi:hypothetical protein AB1Y20_013708 [Prymnesium parvum]|uniref:L-ascorbate peroxidase n=1 Tax=Prymnesium parvum TaxID=97485 RepID=A0AB34IGH8_PRYPA